MDAFTEGLLKNKTVIQQYRAGDGTPQGPDGRTPLYPWQVFGVIPAPPGSGSGSKEFSVSLPGIQSVSVSDTSVTVVFTRASPNVIVDLAPVVAAAPNLDELRSAYKDAFLQLPVATPATAPGLQATMDAVNKIATERYRTDFRLWSFMQILFGGGPVGTAGLGGGK